MTTAKCTMAMTEDEMAQWLAEQTFAYWAGFLTPEQIIRLENLPLFNWRHYLPSKLKKHTDDYIRKWFMKQLY